MQLLTFGRSLIKPILKKHKFKVGRAGQVRTDEFLGPKPRALPAWPLPDNLDGAAGFAPALISWPDFFFLSTSTYTPLKLGTAYES